MGETPNPTPRLMWLLPATLVLCAAAALIGMFVFLQQNGPPGPPGPPQQGNTLPVLAKLSRDASLELLSLRDRALAHLENHEFDQAESLLLKIIREVPGDPFGPRNLLICREMAIEKMDARAEQRPEALRLAREAADQLLALEPRSHVPHVLAARVALKENEPDRAAAALRRATEIAPQAAPPWYDLFLLNPLAPGEPPNPDTVDSLRKVHELEPDNLFVLKDWLPLQTQLKEPGLADTIDRARQTLGPYVDVIKSNIRIDVWELLDKLAKAVQAQQWPVATSTSMMLRNVIVAESARDERYVRWNSLEYSLLDFGPAFYDRADLPESSGEPIEVTFAAGVLPVSSPAAARDLVVIDLDLDGKHDGVALLQQRVVATLPLSAGPGDPEPATVAAEIGEGFTGLLAVDLDDDVDPQLREAEKSAGICLTADPDLVIFGPAGIRLYENRRADEGDKREFVEKGAGEPLAAVRDVRAVVPGDLDLDGDLDFVTISAAGIQMWSNRGNWTFQEISSRSELPGADFDPLAGVAVDWDRDTDLDLVVSGTGGIGLLESLRHGRFRWRPLDGDFERLKGSTSLLVEQRGRRPSWSLVGAGAGGLHAVWTQTTVAGLVSSTSAVRVVEGPVEKGMSLDLDNDGVRDLLAVSGGGVSLWRGRMDGGFDPLASDRSGGVGGVTALAIADVDRDGDEDLLFSSADAAGWHSNNGGNANGWLDITLLAMAIKPNEQNYNRRVNHAGIGSMIELRAGAQYQAQVVRGSVTHFGTGPRKSIEAMRVLWTNGIPHNRLSLEPNQVVCEEQKLHGSCPYLYGWDGGKFVFCTDLLWNAPLGLKFAEDVVAPWREWEYLKVDGHHLRSRDGRYPLRVTAELWEVEYFDQIKLYAVDHPAGTDVFTNEKVGPASMAEPGIHTVRAPRLPVAATDARGRDLLPQVAARDGSYTRTFDRKLAQGLTEEHYLELDLGDWKPPAADDASKPGATPRVVLFLTGWMYPGTTSTRVQHSQNPDMAQPTPPALHAVDADGQWRVARPFLGFPGGKTKTIAVDISDVFAADSRDHRLRIVTNMEFYWDHVFFTVDDRPVEYRQSELPLVRADLRDRGGVSRRAWPATGNGPDQFDYHDLVPGDSWPPIDGAFTRFGDVLPLLATRDDHLVVMHPGDEIQLEFAVPADPLPEGWVRDFVFYSVGWDKDCDQNTVCGETSEPLPFQAMTAYPLQNGQSRERDPDYVRYLNTYQTRKRPRGPFWNGLR